MTAMPDPCGHPLVLFPHKDGRPDLEAGICIECLQVVSVDWKSGGDYTPVIGAMKKVKEKCPPPN